MNSNAPHWILKAVVAAALCATAFLARSAAAQPDDVLLNLLFPDGQFMIYKGSKDGFKKGAVYEAVQDGLSLGEIELTDVGENYSRGKTRKGFAGALAEGAWVALREPRGDKAEDESRAETEIRINLDLGGGRFMTYSGSESGLAKGNYQAKNDKGETLGDVEFTEVGKKYSKAKAGFEGLYEGQTLRLAGGEKREIEPKKDEEEPKPKDEPEEEPKADEPEKEAPPAAAAPEPSMEVPKRNPTHRMSAMTRMESHSEGDELVYETFAITKKVRPDTWGTAFIAFAWNRNRSRMSNSLFGLSFQRRGGKDTTYSYGVYDQSLNGDTDLGLPDSKDTYVFAGAVRTLWTEEDGSTWHGGATLFSRSNFDDNRFANVTGSYNKPVNRSSRIKLRCTYAWDISNSRTRNNQYEIRYDRELNRSVSVGIGALVLDSRITGVEDDMLRLDYRWKR